MSESYVAFISYSHRDSQWAKWVQRSLENYRVPKSLATERGLPRKLGKVFRDREELSTGQNLGDHLTAALDASENLIVICSPHSKASPWVANEIEYFKARGLTHRIFCLLVDGGAESFSEPLLTDADGAPLEPLAADPRTEADGKRLAKLKLISGILNTNLDQLAQREKARRQRLFIAWSNAALVLVGIFLFLEQARQNEAEKKALERQYGIENVATMTRFFSRSVDYYDVKMLDSATQDFSDYLTRFPNEELDPDQMAIKAEALRILARAGFDLGKRDIAEVNYRESRDLYKTASAAAPDNVDLAIEAAFADFYLGSFFLEIQDYDAARGPMKEYSDSISQLLILHPEHPTLIAEAVYAPTAKLKLEIDAGVVFNPAMEKAIEEATLAADLVSNKFPANIELITAAQTVMEYSGDASMKSCQVHNALQYRQKAFELSNAALKLDPQNRRYKLNSANALVALAQMHLILRQGTEASSKYEEVIRIQKELSIEDENNIYLKGRHLGALLELFASGVFEPTPETNSQGPLLLHEINSEENREIAKLQGLENYRDYYLLMDSLNREDPRAKDILLLQLHTRHADYLTDDPKVTLLNAITLLANLTLPSPNQVTPKLGVVSTAGENCNDRLINWANALASGDILLASQLLEEAFERGQKGMVLGFFADRLANQSPSPDAE